MSDWGLVALGWWLFVGCAALFIAAALAAGDPVATLGSALFMAGNVAFMIPHYRARPSRNRED